MINTIKLKLLFSFLLTLSFLVVNAQVSNPAEQVFKEQLRFLQNVNAPNFSLQDTSGKTVQLKSFRSQIVVLDFWFTNCAPCIGNIPYFELTKSFYTDSSNIVFVSICIDNIERKDHWKSLIKKHNITGINLFLPKNRKQTENNEFYKDTISSFPTYLLISKKGQILGNFGNIDSTLPLLSIHRAFEGKTTEDSFDIFLTMKDKWYDDYGSKIAIFKKELNDLDKKMKGL